MIKNLDELLVNGFFGKVIGFFDEKMWIMGDDGDFDDKGNVVMVKVRVKLVVFGWDGLLVVSDGKKWLVV